MATAKTRTIVPLDRFAAILGMAPVHFNQVYIPDIAEAGSCASVIYQYDYQAGDKASRETIAQAIQNAEEQIANLLGYNIGPKWEVADKATILRPRIAELYATSGRNIRGQNISVKANRGYVISGGSRAKSLIDDNVTIVYSDGDSDGYNETATVTVNTTVTDVDELALFYPGQSGSDEWEIRPLTTVAISAGVATITFRREQAVLKALLEKYGAESVDGSNNANFLTVVDVYRVYNNPEVQVQLIWEGSSCSCGNGCGFSIQTGCSTVRDARLGLMAIGPGTWNSDDNDFDYTPFTACRVPDRVELWYKAGWRNQALLYPNRQIDTNWERAVCYLALTYLSDLICTCPIVEKKQTYWKEDMALRFGGMNQSKSFQHIPDIDNPLGSTRAAINAWHLIKTNMLGDSCGD